LASRQTLALTWVGFDDNTPTGLAGGDAAAPIWARYMLATVPGQPNVDFPTPPGVVFAEYDETSGGLASPQCPRNVIVTGAFKDGTQPTMLCPIHAPQMAPLTVDQFGIPINLDTMQPTTTEGMPVTGSEVPPESTLTGGVFRTDTAAPPPPVPQPTPPPITTSPTPTTTRDRDRDRQPPPSTNTSEPPVTNTDTTGTTGTPPPPPPR